MVSDNEGIKYSNERQHRKNFAFTNGKSLLSCFYSSSDWRLQGLSLSSLDPKAQNPKVSPDSLTSSRGRYVVGKMLLWDPGP